MNIEPIKPSEAVEQRKVTIPNFVIKAFNELILENLTEGESKHILKSVVLQSEAIERILKHRTAEGDLTPFDYKWLNVELIYRKAGWYVLYDKPAYNETYPAKFTFSCEFV